MEVDEAILSYTYGMTWYNASMNQEGYTFNATIPTQPYDTFVQYRIYANDTNGNWADSDLFSYTVADFVEPQIETSQNPVQPRANQIVNVLANVIEPVDASGVKTVLFSYRVNSGQWWNTTMVFNETLQQYECTMPGQQASDLVEYYVRAQDNAVNENTTETFSYVVALAGDANLDHTVNILDTATISAHWYPGSPIGPLGYDPDFDLNGDGAIDIIDAAIVNSDWHQTW